MKVNILSILLVSIVIGGVSAQNPVDYCQIRNYKHDVMLIINSNKSSFTILSDYGNIINLSGKDKYMFQGQEWDKDLGIYFYPSRIYSPIEKRFFQPDPKSQYHSPYLFVAADPVNIVDRDGNQGKSLVLSGIEDQAPMKTYASKLGSYDYTLVDFLDNKIPDLPEWNGNVYIASHMGEDGAIQIEEGAFPGKINSFNVLDKKGVKTNFYNEKVGSSGGAEALSRRGLVEIDGKSIGSRLKQFSLERDVKLKNVVFGGCHGGEAAKQASTSFQLEPNKVEFEGAKTNFFGTKKGFYASEALHDGQINMQWMPSDSKVSASPDMMVNYKGNEYKAYSYVPEGESSAYPAYGTPNEPVINDLLEHGRMSSYTGNFMEHIPTSY